MGKGEFGNTLANAKKQSVAYHKNSAQIGGLTHRTKHSLDILRVTGFNIRDFHSGLFCHRLHFG